MKTVAIVSLKGGVGKTTTAANLGAALARREHGDVLLVDLDPRNQLGIHLGLTPDVAGLAQASLRGVSWARAVQRSLDGVACLPFGAGGDGGDFDALLARRPTLLGEALADLALQTNRLAVLDTAPWPSPLLDQALVVADLVIVALLADAASFATLPALQTLVRRQRARRPGGANTWLLLNGVDGTRLGRDVRAVLTAQHALPALPFIIHRDTAVPEALAQQRPILAISPSSQAADDFERGAEWILDQLQAGDEQRARPVNRPESVSVAEVPPPAQGASR
jgi:cellulose synthase operon protein YhjQ